MIGMFAKKIPSDKNQAMQQKIGELGRPKNKNYYPQSMAV
jgi:hypothetical protein